MEKERFLIEKPARRYFERGGFIEGKLVLTRNALSFKANDKKYSQKIPLRQIIELSIRKNPKIQDKPKPNTLLELFMSLRFSLWSRSPPTSLSGTFIYIKSKTNEDQETTGWFRLYEDPEETYHAIHKIWSRYR